MNPAFALVTGTSSGIGAAIARRLLDRGWTVAGIARRQPSFDSPAYRHLALDLTDVDASASAIERDAGAVLDRTTWSRVALVNNAAEGGLLGPAERIEPSDLQRMLAVNVTSAIWLMGFILRHGPATAPRRIVNVSSAAAVRAFPGLAAYGASKAALRMAGMDLAEEMDSPARPGPALDVSILSYEPGTVDTAMQRRTRALGRDQFPWVDLFQGLFDRGLLVAPERPAEDIVAFLESDGQARFTERRFGRDSSQ